MARRKRVETILGPIQRPFVSVTALFVLDRDVEYVTINPDSPINLLGEINSSTVHAILLVEKKKTKKEGRKIAKYLFLPR